MSPKAIQFRLGVGACIAALFLAIVAIPTWVSSPSNVANIVLSPVFWPYFLTCMTGIIGVGLLLAARSQSDRIAEEDYDPSDGRSWHRLAMLAAIMIATMYALPRLGMVWTAMIVFALTALILKTRHPIAAMICAVAVPLVLYGFFAHVAGVAIPQGNFVRLP